MKRLFMAFAFIGLMALFLAACSGPYGSAAASDPNAVHMSDNNFVQKTITIKKGDRITLINDSATAHIITNGEYDSNGTAKPITEPGAPIVEASFNGNDKQQVGPFNTAGTFHLYCTIHEGMTLTIIVQ